MLTTLKTLFDGASARQEAAIRQRYAVDLIDQKIRETDAALTSAKATLASLIQRHRTERAQADRVNARINAMTARVGDAVARGLHDLAREGAAALADLENEATMRAATVARLDTKVERMKLRVEKAQRQLLDLRQGAHAARAVRAEQDAAARIATATPGSSAREAKQMIDDILHSEDGGEISDIFEEIDAELTHSAIEDRLAAQGCGSATKVTADAVLARFK